ncbi:hypothetical protein KFK09_013084 [Dendrobium nobile]|uniref:Uncharacterized protein n=1 Tax=Dendrobium nobile TaxID=94219 RepID=A0A8T3BL68_DENNO|nr:hypothetical protein KFK09_013084 [Dendrobium nobile]
MDRVICAVGWARGRVCAYVQRNERGRSSCASKGDWKREWGRLLPPCVALDREKQRSRAMGIRHRGRILDQKIGASEIRSERDDIE